MRELVLSSTLNPICYALRRHREAFAELLFLFEGGGLAYVVQVKSGRIPLRNFPLGSRGVPPRSRGGSPLEAQGGPPCPPGDGGGGFLDLNHKPRVGESLYESPVSVPLTSLSLTYHFCPSPLAPARLSCKCPTTPCSLRCSLFRAVWPALGHVLVPLSLVRAALCSVPLSLVSAALCSVPCSASGKVNAITLDKCTKTAIVFEVRSPHPPALQRGRVLSSSVR